MKLGPPPALVVPCNIYTRPRRSGWLQAGSLQVALTVGLVAGILPVVYLIYRSYRLYLGKLEDLIAPDKMDFRPKPDCPAFKSGFEAIPTEKIGLQADAYRVRSAEGSLSIVP